MNERANELLGEIVHLVSEAIVADREDMKRQALADIADAIAKVLPVERTASGGRQPSEDELHEAATEEPMTVGCPSLTPRQLPGGFDGTYYTPAFLAEFAKKMQAEQQREEARQKRKIHWKCYETKVDLAVMGMTEQNGKVYEVRIAKRAASKVQDTYGHCMVNGKNVLTCNFTGSAWMLKRILTRGMQALVNYKAKRNRNQAKRKAEAGEEK